MQETYILESRVIFYKVIPVDIHYAQNMCFFLNLMFNDFDSY